MAPEESIAITTEFIKLDAFMKLAGAVRSGGEAKQRVQNGEIQVNGEICTQRGKKLRDGDRVQIDGRQYMVRQATVS